MRKPKPRAGERSRVTHVSDLNAWATLNAWE